MSNITLIVQTFISAFLSCKSNIINVIHKYNFFVLPFFINPIRQENYGKFANLGINHRNEFIITIFNIETCQFSESLTQITNQRCSSKKKSFFLPLRLTSSKAQSSLLMSISTGSRQPLQKASRVLFFSFLNAHLFCLTKAII